MSGTPIFEQLCRELAETGEPELCAPAAEHDQDVPQSEDT